MYERLIPVMQAVRESFSVEKEAEITLEINPDGASERILTAAAEAGINRLSVGAQSGSDKMLSLLGRTHTAGGDGLGQTSALHGLDLGGGTLGPSEGGTTNCG